MDVRIGVDSILGELPTVQATAQSVATILDEVRNVSATSAAFRKELSVTLEKILELQNDPRIESGIQEVMEKVMVTFLRAKMVA